MAGVSRWSFVLGPASGGMDFEITSAKARKATFNLSSPSSASFSLNGRDPLAEQVVELSTDLHLLRYPDVGPAQRIYRGRIGATADMLDENRHTVSVASLDYRAVLDRRTLYADSQLTWTGIPQASIAAGLVAQTQVRSGGDLGIAPGAGAGGGTVRDRTYEAGDSIGQRIQELSEVVDGFDWDITTPSASELSLDIFSPERGADRGVVFEYGGLVRTVSRQVDPGNYVNALRMSGQAPEGSSVEPAPVERAAADIATAPQGRWDKAFGQTGITTAEALSERADWQLAEAQVIRPSYSVTLKRGAWKGPDHVWLGDTVRLAIRSGRLKVNTLLRVQTIDVDISDSGDESVSMTIGAPRVDYRRRAVDTEKRIADLERR